MGREKATIWLVRGLMMLGLSGLLVAGYAWTRIAGASPGGFNGTTYSDTPAAPAFQLVDHTGEPRSLSDFRGRAVLLFFGFTRCPDVCPLTLARLAAAIRENDFGAEDVEVLLVSVDPEYDTPARLAEYIEPHGPAITGLTGSQEDVSAILARYGAYAELRRSHDGTETLAHTGIVFAIDAAGRLRALLHPEESGAILEQDIRTLVTLRR